MQGNQGIVAAKINGGKWPDIVPHLSVASLADELRLDRVADEFAQASRGILPIRATAAEVALMDNRSGRWQARATLGFGECVTERATCRDAF